ncbi:AAA family ATPase [Cellvibrio sp. QJXJ]|uniref:AAA family ATPase n=1 Tax=Cellvibrio sp. QJXJ TaxID=2964606 RepID=UPI0021C35C8D|nr:ATP-binding protein [Cellvibrio sp. QJXJ]UUA71925.1 ATP-binding protein [Cellvibrio sp. QJXJ]
MDRKINFRRWSDVILLGLVSYAWAYLIASVSAVQVAFGKWVSLFSSLHMAVQILLALTGFYCARHLLLFFNVIHKRQLKNIQLCLAYPPITFSIVLCLLLFLSQFDVINFFRGSLFVSYFLAAALLFIILLSLLCAYDSLYSEKRKDKQELVLVPDCITDEEQKNHYRWLMSERPLDECDKDILGRGVYVTRIARLFEPVDGKRKHKANHIAIVGPFGIGKTSTWKSVKQQLGDDYIFVPVEGWGRGEGTVAAQIIDDMVATLTNYVDCASIRNVPKEYMAALSGADFKGISTLAKILPLHSHHSPEELIRKIETILLSIGKAMVVVLEDFDRNPQEENIMNEVAGLLDRLRDLRSINFIVCLAPGVPSYILSRISLYREDLLSFDAQSLVENTIDLMQACVKRKDGAWFGDEPLETDEFVRAMSKCIKTPRDAKYVLRRALNAWEKGLDGEVNMYDLMAVNVLRYCAPEAFDFMVENYDQMREGVRDVDSPMRDALAGKAIDLLSKAGVDELNARSLIKILWPSWHSADGVPLNFNVQRVAGRLGRVYLERILTEKISPRHEAETDLEFFLGIHGGDRHCDEAFMNKLCGSKYWSEKFIELVGYSCQNTKKVEQRIVEVFIDFMVRSCRDGKDIFFNNLPNVSSTDITFIVSKVSEKNKEDVFALFIDQMRDDPEKLFSELRVSLYGAYPDQKRLWIEHKEDLQACLDNSSNMSAEAKLNAQKLLFDAQ